MAGTTLTLTPDGFRGRVLGKYEVLCRLSTGGMAEIFLAAQKGLAGFRKMVVLKQILPDIRGEEEFVRMFLDEAKVTAAFNHPHIAHVYDLDVADGELFLAMEFVPGATLVEVARACRSAHEPIPMGLSLMAVRDTAVALNYAHSFTDPLGRPSPVVHRDVAEKNIMVTYEGVTKLLDFGIAKSLARAGRTQVGMVKGTSGYMSPEQIMGDPLDARSDLFSLGVVLHECLTGMRLFYAKSAEAMMNAVLSGDVTPPSRVNKEVPPELDAIVLKALAKRREDRYGTTLEFARAIERAVGPRIWHPEQSSELMLRLFTERRDQTRLLLMSGQSTGDGTSSETQVAQVLARGADAPEPVTMPPTGALPQISSALPPRAPAAPPKAPAPAKAAAAPALGTAAATRRRSWRSASPRRRLPRAGCRRLRSRLRPRMRCPRGPTIPNRACAPSRPCRRWCWIRRCASRRPRSRRPLATPRVRRSSRRCRAWVPSLPRSRRRATRRSLRPSWRRPTSPGPGVDAKGGTRRTGRRRSRGSAPRGTPAMAPRIRVRAPDVRPRRPVPRSRSQGLDGMRRNRGPVLLARQRMGLTMHGRVLATPRMAARKTRGPALLARPRTDPPAMHGPVPAATPRATAPRTPGPGPHGPPRRTACASPSPTPRRRPC
ncbi:serine/threonine-protein kinase [Corallococcus sp. 4LFB]|uniref:serine/threonine-protein kinase n=1 Tax=Corallococcus sp. 4LFB TaxID=3383249 RepID=UPI003976D7D2